MSKVLEVFETTRGVKVKKVEASDGRIMRFASEPGQSGATPISPASYGAYKSHTPDNEKFDRGNLKDVETTEGLGFPYNSRTFKNIESEEKGTEARKRIQQNNQWIGFLSHENTPDDPMEAAELYQEMVGRLKDVDDPDRQEEIKRDYNIGGSP